MFKSINKNGLTFKTNIYFLEAGYYRSISALSFCNFNIEAYTRDDLIIILSSPLNQNFISWNVGVLHRIHIGHTTFKKGNLLSLDDTI